ncbi:hypothetical protein GQR36_16455 [Enterococcus termitis]
MDFVDLDWSALLDELIHTFPQIAWIGGSKEKEDNRVVYYIDFVPIAYRETNFPFMVNLLQSLEQQLIGESDDVLALFVNEIERLVSKFVKPLTTSNPKVKAKPKPKVEAAEHNVKEANINYVLKMEEAVSRERYAKERMRLANKKLEVVIDQMERQNLSRAINELSKPNNNENEDWDQLLKIDLREYSQLLQKAKFLEQSWMMNKELVTKSEKMTISDNRLTYEREQVRSFKESVSTNEIYLILEECKLIESRVKIKKKSWFRQPHVRIMKMDYDSILNKAAYFDLIQGENFLLEQIVLNEEPDDLE